MKCYDKVKEKNVPCPEQSCRYWLDYPCDLNCTILAVEKHGAMKLHQVGDRLHLTAARIKQIESEVLKRMSKHSELLKIIEE